MDVQKQIDDYIDGQSEPKRADMRELHRRIRQISPDCKLWFLNGRNDENKIVSNPNIGYGSRPIRYANGDTREFYQIGLSANTAGLSVYVMGIEDKESLAKQYGSDLGAAKVSGYCVKFRSLKVINIDVLEQMIAEQLAS